MAPEEKKPFEKLAAADRVRYTRECGEFMKRNISDDEDSASVGDAGVGSIAAGAEGNSDGVRGALGMRTHALAPSSKSAYRKRRKVRALNHATKRAKTQSSFYRQSTSSTVNGSSSITSTPAITSRQKRTLAANIPLTFSNGGTNFRHDETPMSCGMVELLRQQEDLMERAKMKAAQYNAANKSTGTKLEFRLRGAAPTLESKDTPSSNPNFDGQGISLSSEAESTKNSLSRVYARKQKKSSKAFHHHCQYCNKGFRFTTNWRAHERTHTGEKLFVCEWKGCQKRFAHPASLQAHIAKHQGIKPFSCTQEGCTQKFANKSNLNRHMRRIHHMNTKGQKLPPAMVEKMRKSGKR